MTTIKAVTPMVTPAMDNKVIKERIVLLGLDLK
jgi:hypothetical protein